MRGDTSILIVGAGPTGLTAAVELARHGIVPRIIDRDDGPTPLSKAVGISSHSLDLLEPSGVTTRLLNAGIRIRRGHVHYGTRELGVVRFDVLHHRFNFLLSLPQSETETLMADVLSGFGGRVEWRTQLVSLERAGQDVRVTLEGPNGREEARHAMVFGADGVRSRVREAVGVEFRGYTHERIWSIADVDVADWPYEAGAAQLFLLPGGDIGFIIPIGTARFRAVSNTPDAMTCIPGNYRITRVLLTDTFRIDIRQATVYQKGDVFLGGDAAHVQSPVGARGMNLGIEDAVAFARRYVQGTLDGYTQERHPVGKHWIALSERLLSVAQARDWGTIALRNLAFAVVGHVAALQRPVVERVAGVRE